MNFFIPTTEAFRAAQADRESLRYWKLLLENEDNDPIGYWSLDDGSGLVARDLSGNGNHGTLEGTAPTWVDGVNAGGHAANFPGTDERIDCGNGAPLDDIGNGSFWISFWMKSKDEIPNNSGMLFSKTTAPTDYIELYSYGIINRLQFQSYKDSVGLTAPFSTNSTVFDTIFNHIVLVINRTTDKALLYINTIKDATEIDISTLPADSSNAANLSWGSRHDGTVSYEGILDEMRVYSGVPTEEQITNLFENPNGMHNKTALIENNQISGGCNANGYSKWTAVLRNQPEVFKAGDYAGAKCEIHAKVGTAEYIRAFTGFVTPEGCLRSQDNQYHDVVTLNMEDRSKHIAMKRRVEPKVLVNYKICNTVTTSVSIMHELSGYMDLPSTSLVVSTMNYVKPYLPLHGKQTAFVEMRKMAEQYLGTVYFRYDGKLLFASRFRDDYAGPSSEHTFDLTNIIDIRSRGTPIQCNKVNTEYQTYEALDAGSLLYRNTDNWDTETQKCAIAVAGDAYWPGPHEGDVARLQYKDPVTGESYPIAVTVITPDLGAAGANKAIESTGGNLTLVSFNGSTTATKQRVDSSEIILLNDSSVATTINKMEIYGTPLSIQSKRLVEDRVSGLEDWEYIEKKIPGEYVVDDDQAHVTTQWWKDFGATPRTAYKIIADWIPQIAKGALITLNSPGMDTSLACFVESFQHPAANGPMTKQVTTVDLLEQYSFIPTGWATIQHDAYSRQTFPFVLVEASDSVRQGGMYRCSGADDHVEIQLAIDLMVARGGGIVHLSEGHFYITAAIELTSNVTLQGQGEEATTIEKNCDDYAIKAVGSAEVRVLNIAIKNLTVTRNAADTNYKRLVYLEYADYIIVSGCLFSNADDGAVFGSLCDGVDIMINRFVDNAGSDVVLDTEGMINVSGNTFMTTTVIVSKDYCVWIQDGAAIVANNTFSNIKSDGVCRVIAITGGSKVLIDGNRLENIQGAIVGSGDCIGIYLGDLTSYLYNVSICNNQIMNLHGGGSSDNGLGILISAGVVAALVASNTCLNNGNLIDRGNCESTTSAMIFGETVPVLVDALWARDDAEADEGTYSYKFTKNVAAGDYGIVYLVDNADTTDMHGLIANREYTLTMRIWIPSGGILGSEILLQLLDYDGSFVATQQAAANTYDEWQTVTVTRTLRAAATGFIARIAAADTAEDGELFYVDNVRLQPLGIHNEHEQNFKDGGTETTVMGNGFILE